jgi:hypothetical protein
VRPPHGVLQPKPLYFGIMRPEYVITLVRQNDSLCLRQRWVLTIALEAERVFR